MIGAGSTCTAALLCLPALAALGVASGAPAAEPGSAPDERPVLYETATVRARPLASATGAVTVLDREEIEALDVSSVAELVRFIPGLDLVSSGPRGGVANAQIRGGDPNFTVVLLDGVPLNDITDTFGGSVNLNGLSTKLVERIEVVRGPLSSFYGSAGLAGVVNIITRRGESDRPQAAFELAGGDTVAQAAASLSEGNDQSDYFAGATWERASDQVADDHFEQKALQGNWRRELGQKSALRVTGRITSWEGRDYPEASGGILGTGETRKSEHDEASLGLELLLGPRERSHKLYLIGYRHALDRTTPAIPGSQPAITDKTTYWSGRLGWAWPLLQRGKTTLTIGAEADHDDGESDSFVFAPPQFGGGPGSYRIDRSVGAAFAEYLAEHGRVELELGARMDVPEGFDTEFSPRLGVAYRFPDKATRLRCSVGRAFKLPSFFALAYPIVGNPDLQPEVSTGGDVGVEHSFEAARLSTSASLFYYEYEDLVTFDFSLPIPRLVNLDSVRSRGGELSSVWQATDAISLRTNVTYQDVENTATGSALLQRPKWIGGARLGWRIGERFRWSIDGQWVSESLDHQIPVLTRDHVAGYRLLGTALSVHVTPHWELDGRVDNLLDEDYETLIGFPGPERRFRVGLRLRS